MVWYQSQKQEQDPALMQQREQIMGRMQGAMKSGGLYTGLFQQINARFNSGMGGGQQGPQGSGGQQGPQGSGPEGRLTGGDVREMSSKYVSPQGQPAYARGQQGSSRSIQPGGTNLNDLASYLARQYGIALGRQPMVDERGNFLRHPTNADEAVKFQFISQAIADEQNRRAQQKSVSALQAGIGQTQSRARGSLATMMSGKYEALSDLYSKEQHRAADFSYFVQKEQLDKMDEITKRMEKAAQGQSKGQMWGSLVGTIVGLFVPGVGPLVGGSLGGAIGGAGSSAGWY